MSMSHRERIERTISGQSVDRPAVSLWRHFPVDDQNSEDLARAVLQFQSRFDFDFIKITSASSFCIKDWGVQDEWQGNPEGTRKITHTPIQTSSDWGKLKTLSPTQGSLGEQLKAIQLIRQGTPDTTPIIPTIFSPLSQAKNLVGRDNLVAHMRMYPTEVKQTLQIITDVTKKYVEECLNLRVDGILFSVKQAQY
jgi:uroporphyrinogen decarboxylase